MHTEMDVRERRAAGEIVQPQRARTGAVCKRACSSTEDAMTTPCRPGTPRAGPRGRSSPRDFRSTGLAQVGRRAIIGGFAAFLATSANGGLCDLRRSDRFDVSFAIRAGDRLGRRARARRVAGMPAARTNSWHQSCVGVTCSAYAKALQRRPDPYSRTDSRIGQPSGPAGGLDVRDFMAERRTDSGAYRRRAIRASSRSWARWIPASNAAADLGDAQG